MRDDVKAPGRESRRVAATSFVFAALIVVYAMIARWRVIDMGMARPIGKNIYFRLYDLYEQPFLVLLALFAVGSAIAVYAMARRDAVSAEQLTLPAPTAARVALVALVVLLAGLAITNVVMHRLLFSMDEFSADFQARAFARGEYAPLVPWPWRSLRDSIVPIFVQFHEDSGRWVSQYLPVYSLLKAPFVMIGQEVWLNPLLSAGTIVAMAAVARRLWPAEGVRPWVAIALLATSSQFLVTSGSGYSMPGHLLFNLVWLWLYVRGDGRSWAAALVVGVLSFGLHQPVPHALFVAPFMLRLLRERRWGRLGSAVLAYTVGAALWFAWMRFANPTGSSSESGLLSLFSLPSLAAIDLHVMNVALLFTWQAPLLACLVLVAMTHPRRLEPVQADLAFGVVVTLGFFVFYPSTQGHGWGYRYAHQVLGNLCLLAAAGLPTVLDALGGRVTRRWLATGLALALLVQIPLRLRDVEEFVRPFAAGVEYVRDRDAAVVLIRADSVWYGDDLVRNDPFLRNPIVVRQQRLAPSLIAELKRVLPGRVVELSNAELLALGMTAASRRPLGDRSPVGSQSELPR